MNWAKNFLSGALTLSLGCISTGIGTFTPTVSAIQSSTSQVFSVVSVKNSQGSTASQSELIAGGPPPMDLTPPASSYSTFQPLPTSDPYQVVSPATYYPPQPLPITNPAPIQYPASYPTYPTYPTSYPAPVQTYQIVNPAPVQTYQIVNPAPVQAYPAQTYQVVNPVSACASNVVSMQGYSNCAASSQTQIINSGIVIPNTIPINVGGGCATAQCAVNYSCASVNACPVNYSCPTSGNINCF